uniref:FAD-binding PCMH-type domain-containing protein n=2 Tax=Brassica oleracea var. oleracea TaxID=109376 RepID=A0A0D3BC96_BRAOL
MKISKRLKERDTSKDRLACTAQSPGVDLGEFRNIIEINRAKLIARVETLVKMGQISRASVHMNLSLAVVGLINGYGIEGSSHLYGLFSDTVEAYEIVLAGVELVCATKDNEYSDLFYAIPWSQGTLGPLAAAEIKVIPVRE